MQIALLLHGSLMTGSWLGAEKWGDRFIEIVAGWSILLVVTGVILWWPRGGDEAGCGGLSSPGCESRSTRTRWRDVHAITGVHVLVRHAVLPRDGDGMDRLVGDEVPGDRDEGRIHLPPRQITDGVSSKTLGTSLDGQDAMGEPVASRALSGEPGGKHVHVQHHGAGIVKWDPAEGAPLDAVITRAQILGFTPGFAVFFPFDDTGSYSITLGPDLDPAPNQSAFDERTAFVDQYTAESLDDVKFGQFGAMAKATDLGISLHEGREWGIWSQILALMGTLAILLSSATSIVMWRKRRPKGLGAPKRVASKRVTAIRRRRGRRPRGAVPAARALARRGAHLRLRDPAADQAAGPRARGGLSRGTRPSHRISPDRLHVRMRPRRHSLIRPFIQFIPVRMTRTDSQGVIR